MAYGSVRLIPGVNVERTPTLLETSISQSRLIRFKDGLSQKLGGWQRFYPNSLGGGIPRDMHVWEDLIGNDHLAIGTTTQLVVITSGNLVDITPQSLTTNPTPNFTTTAGSTSVEISDPSTSGLTVFDSVLINTPISVGGIILSGLYAIVQTTGASSYLITAASAATSSVANGGAVPQFTTMPASNVVTVTLADVDTAPNSLASGDVVVFSVSTTGDGVTIFSHYPVNAVSTPNSFTIIANTQGVAGATFSMNGGNAQFVYSINLGPPPAGVGYGLGGYGDGGYGTGVVGSAQTGTPITAIDWTTDNWGEILLACPQGGGVYLWDPTGGFQNAGLVPGAPPLNGGIFVSMNQQILVCWGSTKMDAVGIEQDPLLVSWSDVGDFSDFVPLTTNQAGSYRIGNGSMIRAAMAVANQNLIWTDLDVWAMNYQGQPFVFGFNKIGPGAGSISSHAICVPGSGGTYWMGNKNFYAYDQGGVRPLPCPVWDFVFQNLDTANAYKVRALPNTTFNEAGWAFPSLSSPNGECDSYVKFNVAEPGAPWDYGASGTMPRSAWVDESVLGPPISTISTGVVYQQETTNDADGQPLISSFTTSYFYLAEGEEYAFIDQVIPDMKWATYTGTQSAQVQLTFNVINYPGDTPVSYGPYIVNSTTEFITVRFRGRQMSVTVASSDIGSFWRLGRIRYRYSADGRR